jgi:uncharacterized protein
MEDNAMVVKPEPLTKEEQYFLETEVKRLKKIHEEHLHKTAQAEKLRLKDLHYLHCAKCGQEMATTVMAGVEIEVCADCGGIYLDAGELEKIISEKTRGPFAEAAGFMRRLWKAS